MEEMPNTIKNKIRKLHKYALLLFNLQLIVDQIFESYGIDPNVFYATAGKDVNQNEAMAYIINGESNVEGSINLIEELFLYYINKSDDNEECIIELQDKI